MTRLDRNEPTLNENAGGDVRDTTSLVVRGCRSAIGFYVGALGDRDGVRYMNSRRDKEPMALFFVDEP